MVLVEPLVDGRGGGGEAHFWDPWLIMELGACTHADSKLEDPDKAVCVPETFLCLRLAPCSIFCHFLATTESD